MDVRVGSLRRLSTEELMPSNGGGEDSWELLRQSILKEINPEYSLERRAEALILWPPDGKRQHPGKNLDAGEDWGQVEKGTTEDEMVGWYHWLSGHEFEQTHGVSEGVLLFMGSRVGHDLTTEQRGNYNLVALPNQRYLNWVSWDF